MKRQFENDKECYSGLNRCSNNKKKWHIHLKCLAVLHIAFQGVKYHGQIALYEKFEKENNTGYIKLSPNIKIYDYYS